MIYVRTCGARLVWRRPFLVLEPFGFIPLILRVTGSAKPNGLSFEVACSARVVFVCSFFLFFVSSLSKGSKFASRLTFELAFGSSPELQYSFDIGFETVQNGVFENTCSGAFVCTC